MKRSTVGRTALLATLAIGSGTAYAGTSHILGSGGPQVKLDAQCHRAVVAPPGETVKMDVNVLGQQIHCLIRRVDKVGAPGGGGGAPVGVCLDGLPDKRGFEDIKVCQVGDPGFVGSLIAPAQP